MSALSTYLSKQHIFSGERLQAYSDAVFSIIATFSVIPLKFDIEIVKSRGGFHIFDLEEYLYRQWPRYLVYLYSFSLVSDVWFIHTGVFSIIEHVDDVILWLNLLLLFLVSFLPYGTSLVSSYATSLDAEQLAISICAGDILLISVAMMIILLYAYRRQAYLHPEIASNSNIRTIKIASFIALLIKPVIALLAIAFSFLSNAAPWLPLVLFYSIGIISIFIRLIFYTYFRLRKSIDKLPQMIFRSVANKSRTEAFSDGVFAIVGTLIVLDLTSEHLPNPDDLINDHDGSLQVALFRQRFVFLSYMTTFMITGLLWFVQYSMFHFIKKFTPALSIANIGTLFVVGGIPFVSEINSVFSDETFADSGTLFENKILAIRVMSVVVVLAGLLQLVFLCVAHHQKSSCMAEEIEHRNSAALLFAKTLVIPIFGIIVYWGTFVDGFIDYHIYTVITFITPFVFLLLKAIFKCHYNCRRAVDKAVTSVNKKAAECRSPTSIQSASSLDIPLLGNEAKVSGEIKEYAAVEVIDSNSPDQ